jgi:phosphoribosylanthranilate isomerase
MTAYEKIRVKVCGITRAEDALALDALGVDYLGFNFWPGSKRYIRPEAAAAIIAQLRHAAPVGVFVDHPPDELASIAAQTGIKAAQLHGSEGWDTLERFGLPVIKAIPHTRLGDWGGLLPEWALRSGQPRHFLVDTQAGPGSGGFGGTGAAFDWNLLKDAKLPRPFFLAGGIGPENIAEAVRVARPLGLYAVDLNSRVETAPGVKDVALVERCLKILTSAGGVP